MATSLETDVFINDEKYSLLSRPSESSALVREEKEKLVGSLDLEQLVTYLGHVGNFIRIAYNGVGAAGPKFQDLQIEIQRLGYDITKLCDKSAITVASFESTSDTILSELEATYEFLLDGFEDQAIISLASLSELAKKMETAAHDLQLEFESQEKKVVSTLERTQKKEASEEIEMKKLKEERERMELQKQAQEKLLEDQKKLEQEAHEERLYYEQKEDEEIESAHSGVLPILGAVLTTVCPPLIGTALEKVIKGKEAAHTKKANEWKEKSRQKLEAEKEFRKLQQEGLQKMADFTYEIARLTSEGNVAKIAIDALHKASGALKELSLIMRRAAIFWNKLSKHCEGLSKVEFQERLNSALNNNYDEDKKRKFFTSQAFKRKAVSYYARWQALHKVCGEYLKYLNRTREDLYAYIRENPTREESRKRLPKLAKEFGEILKSAQDDIAQRDLKADEEMKKLEN